MSKVIKFLPPLTIHKDPNKLSCPQKCKIPQKFLKVPASNFVIVKNVNRKFLCRLFYLNETYDDKPLTYLDDSVEIDPKQEGISMEIKWIDELEIIENSQLKEFSSIKVKLIIDPSTLDLNIIKNSIDFTKTTQSIIKHYTFSSDSLITCERFGISKIHVISTSASESTYGSISKTCLIEISEIEVERKSMRKNIKLGGLENAENSLSHLIEKNIAFMRNQQQFPFKPSCQALLIGPAGSGKSTLIHHISEKYKCNIFEITGDIFMPYPGETEEELQKIFNRIKTISNLISTNLSIILIENIEIFCPTFDTRIKENSHSSRIAAFIFSKLDEISNLNSKGIMVIGTTSKMEAVNNALRRSSRMGTEILIEMPNEDQRYEIMNVLINRFLINIEIDDVSKLSKYIAENTPGFVGADLEVLCQYVIRENDLHKNDIFQLFERALRNVNPSVMRDNLGIVTRSTMNLSDIAGMDELKKSLLTCILGPLKHPEKFYRFGLHSPSGILFYGPSGCAKTTIVKCLAGESKMTLISVSSAEIYSPYVGEAEKFIVRLFIQARMSAPTILFFDEIDTIVGNRNKNNGSDSHMRILSTLLTEIDGFGGNATVSRNKPILIVGATNRPECIDDALMRPGRFDKLIHIPAPDYNYRLQILESLFQKMPIAKNVDIKFIAKRTEFFSGADLQNLCNEAAICAATKDLNCDIINVDDFENVLTFLGPSLDEEKIQFYEEFEKSHLGKK